MPLACNIDRRGRRVRALAGLFALLLGAGILALTWPPPWWYTAGGTALILVGCFQLFEARAGWCVLRAIGVKTPL